MVLAVEASLEEEAVSVHPAVLAFAVWTAVGGFGVAEV